MAKRKETQKTETAKRSAAKERVIEEEIPEERDGLGTEVAIIASFALCVLFFLSNFGLIGRFGEVLSGIMLGIFGVVGYLAPILIFIGVFFFISNRGNMRAMIRLLASVLAVLGLCGMIQLFAGAGDRQLSDFYTQKSGGGWLGGLIAASLENTVGVVGAFLILLVLLAICAVCITGKSLVGFVRDSSDKAYTHAREDMQRRRELREVKQQEENLRREMQRVRGVDIAATELKEHTLSHSIAGKSAEAPGKHVPAAKKEADRSAPRRKPAPAVELVMEPDAVEEPVQAPVPVEEPAVDNGGNADVFSGTIRHGGKPEAVVPAEPEEELPEDGGYEDMLPGDVTDEEEDEITAALYRENEQHIRDEALKKIYVRHDSRTMEELTGDRIGAGREETPSRREEAAPRPAAVNEARPAVSAAPRPAVSPAPHAGAVPAPGREPAFEPESDIPAVRSGNNPGSGYEDEWEVEEDSYEAGPVPTAEDIERAAHSAPAAEGGIPERRMTPVVSSSGKIISTDTDTAYDVIAMKEARQKAAAEAERLRREAEQEVLDDIADKEAEPPKEYIFPTTDLLKKDTSEGREFDDSIYRETAVKLQQTLKTFGVGVKVTDISCGPTVTRYELQPDMGVKVSRVLALQDDIKLNLAAADIRIEAPIPGKAAIGIEVPNPEASTVYMRELLESEAFINHKSKLAFAVGKDIAGQTVVADIAKMPHLLIAGATGSGKSVCINTLIMSVIYKAKPEEVRLIMIDPKVVELSVYNGIPHLLIPVVTDPKKAAGALNWAVAEMTDRYQKFKEYNVRDLKGYNARVEGIADLDVENKPEKLPQIIIIVDELADLMMVAPGEVEDSICRLAQLARAAGIHLVIATQRPSVNVITGLIKANIPSRIAFSVASGVDSRTILDMVGAEKLLGKGDMLFYPSGYPKPRRVQGAFVSDEEVAEVVHFLTEQGLNTGYNKEIEAKLSSGGGGTGGGQESQDQDAYLEQAGRFIIESDKATIGMLQRKFKIGFNRAARIMDQLADYGVVGPEEGTKPRQILMSMEQFENMIEQGG